MDNLPCNFTSQGRAAFVALILQTTPDGSFVGPNQGHNAGYKALFEGNSLKNVLIVALIHVGLLLVTLSINNLNRLMCNYENI